MDQSFEQFLRMHENRIYFQLHRLRIQHRHYDTFYAEGIVALWHAYQTYNQQKGNIGTFLNYTIRYRMIDLLRKLKRQETNTEKVIESQQTNLTNGNHIRHHNQPLPAQTHLLESLPMDNTDFWSDLRKQLTDNQWKWIKYFIIADLTIQEIMELENVSADAVKGWGRAVRKKLRNEQFKQQLLKQIRKD